MNKKPVIPDKLFTQHGKDVERILRRAVRQALWRHKRLGQSVAAWRDGKVVIVPPEQIPVEDDSDGESLSKQERSAKDIEIINRNADRLNEEALDVLDYQIDLWNEVKDEI
ncbi:MAG: hypothetical protein L0Y75_10300 [Acidobacteria bacterium]|nr:hypothetical protein [Acidobacteriota bacterium]